MKLSHSGQQRRWNHPLKPRIQGLWLHYTATRSGARTHLPVTCLDCCAVMEPQPRKVKFRDSAKLMGSALKFFIRLLQANLGERTTQRTACKKITVNKYFKCRQALTNQWKYLFIKCCSQSFFPPNSSSLDFPIFPMGFTKDIKLTTLYSSLPFFLWHLVPMHLSLPEAHTRHSPAHHPSYLFWNERKWSFQRVSNLEKSSGISIQEANELRLQAQKRLDPNFKGKKMSVL